MNRKQLNRRKELELLSDVSLMEFLVAILETLETYTPGVRKQIIMALKRKSLREELKRWCMKARGIEYPVSYHVGRKSKARTCETGQYENPRPMARE